MIGMKPDDDDNDEEERKQAKIILAAKRMLDFVRRMPSDLNLDPKGDPPKENDNDDE